MKKGFTLIELTVGIALLGLVLLGAGILTVTLFSSNARTKQLDELAQAKYDLLAELSNAVRWAETATLIGPGHLRIVTDDGHSIDYTLNAGQLLKNDKVLTSNAVLVTNFEVADYSRSVSNTSLQITIVMQSAKFAAVKDNLRFVVSKRRGNLTTAK